MQISLSFIPIQPVNMFPANSLGFYDVYGNVWEWLEDQFNGLPGFKTHYLYDDFSTPCFDGRHTMMTVSVCMSMNVCYVCVCVCVFGDFLHSSLYPIPCSHSVVAEPKCGKMRHLFTAWCLRGS